MTFLIPLTIFTVIHYLKSPQKLNFLDLTLIENNNNAPKK